MTPKSEVEVYTHALVLVDAIHEDIWMHSAPRMWRQHPKMAELLAIPKGGLTKALIKMLTIDPNWIVLDTLYQLHSECGPDVPVEDRGVFDKVCQHWINWWDDDPTET